MTLDLHREESIGWHCWLANSDGVEVDAGHLKNTGEVIFRGNL
tara:strand:+ start:225 stop:353 length:129 start_codon:yes stop_codon:yes gene_type:complete